MTDIRAKSLAYLRDAKVTIGTAQRWPHEDRPSTVDAKVEGYNGVYRVQLNDDVWTCSCKAITDDGLPCGHAEAVKLVTGHPSAAAKPASAVA